MKAELYILGVLHRGNFHPYEIKRRLTQAMIECFTDVDVGTLPGGQGEVPADDGPGLHRREQFGTFGHGS